MSVGEEKKKEGREKEASDQYLCGWLYCGTEGKRGRNGTVVDLVVVRRQRKAEKNKKRIFFGVLVFVGLCPVLF